MERLRYGMKKGWEYAIRLKGDVEFYDPLWGQPFDWLTLNAIAPLPGKRYALTDLRITKTELYPTHVACAWAVGSDETLVHCHQSFSAHSGTEGLCPSFWLRGVIF